MFTEKEVNFIKELVASNITIEEIKTAIFIARDEEIRMAMQRHTKRLFDECKKNGTTSKDLAEVDRKCRHAFAQMYMTHALAIDHPFEIQKLRNREITEEQVFNYFLEMNYDVEMDSTKGFRPKYT